MNNGRCGRATSRVSPRKKREQRNKCRERGQLTDVLSQNVLKLLLLETTLDNQASATVNRTAGTQLSKQVGGDVLVGTLHALADVGNVGKDGLLVTLTHALRGRDLVALDAAQGVVGVLLRQLVEEALQKRVVAQSLGLVVRPDTGASVHVTRLLLGSGVLGVLALRLLGLKLAGKVVLLVVSLGGLLLLLLLQKHVDTLLALGGVLILGDLLLLLLLQQRQVDTGIVGRGSGGGLGLKRVSN